MHFKGNSRPCRHMLYMYCRSEDDGLLDEINSCEVESLTETDNLEKVKFLNN